MRSVTPARAAMSATVVASKPRSANSSTAALRRRSRAPGSHRPIAETGFPLPLELAAAFTEQYPNVTFDIREDQFAVITQNAPRVPRDSPPDLMRLPQMSELAAGGLLLDLDPCAEVFGGPTGRHPSSSSCRLLSRTSC